jgi:hypothetical protein
MQDSLTVMLLLAQVLVKSSDNFVKDLVTLQVF